jgi:GntR family transcriptional regulator, transcriptional repressor for pyruvate dehydrogenase complex
MLSDNFVESELANGLKYAAEGLRAIESAGHDNALNTVARPQSLADEAHRQLLLQLEMNLWRVGDKLPPEKALAESLGVSRPIVREALARLKADGLIDTRQGAGAFVADRNKIAAFRFAKTAASASSTPADEASATDIAEREMLELRQIVESGAAELAALRRNDADIAAIRAAVDAMDGALGARTDGSAADDAFHNAIAAATHNEQLTKFVAFVGAQFSASRKVTWDKTGYGVGITEVGQEDHRAIFKAIETGDGSKAERLAHEHVQRAIDRVLDRLQRRSTEAAIQRQPADTANGM